MLVASDKKTIRVAVNPVAKLDRYPVPKVEDLFATLKQGRLFTKLDLRHAYQQLRRSTSWSTQQRDCSNILGSRSESPQPLLFSREHLFSGIAGVVVYLDDILVTGEDEETHLKTLEEVFKRLSEADLRVKKEKCLFLASSVVFLGHKIDAEGRPPYVTELKAYLGILQQVFTQLVFSIDTTLRTAEEGCRMEVRDREVTLFGGFTSPV